MLSAHSNQPVHPVQIWTAKDGSVPLTDDPTLNITMVKWSRKPDTTMDVIMHRVSTGQISKNDIDVAVTLARAILLTEKQLRYLYREVYKQGHKLGTRLRYLQQIGWFEGWYVESEFNQREYVWSIGIAARNYLGYALGMQNVPDPMIIAQKIRNYLPICAINDLRIKLIEKKVLDPVEFSFYPNLLPDFESPLALIPISSPMGKLVLYVERLQQGSRPLRHMKRRLNQYLKLIQDNGSLPNPIPNSAPPIIVWSCGSEEAIRSLIGSIDHFPSEIMQLFLVDECMNDLRNAWRIAVKGNTPGEVTLKSFNMDFL